MNKYYLKRISKLSRLMKSQELNILIIKMMLSDLRLSNSLRFYFSRFLFSSNISKIRYYCVKTYKTRGLVHFFNVFRMFFRENALFARYSGIKKKSW